MFIIAGTKGVTSTARRGEFYCPECQRRRSYSHRQVHKKATVFFVPIANMNLLGEYIECNTCLSTYDLHVPDYDPECEEREFHAAYLLAIKRTITMMMLADGNIDDGELAMIGQISDKILGKRISRDELIEEIEECNSSPQTLHEYLISVAPILNEHGKELLIKVACWIAIADGKWSRKEVDFLKELAKSLGLSSAHLDGIIMEVQQQLESET